MTIYHMTTKQPDLVKESTLIIYPMIQKMKISNINNSNNKINNSNKYKNKQNKKFKNSKFLKILKIISHNNNNLE